MIHSKAQWIEMGEKLTKYFFQLENKHKSRNSITELCVNNSSVTSDKNILRECRDFHKRSTLLNQSTWKAKTGF